MRDCLEDFNREESRRKRRASLSGWVTTAGSLAGAGILVVAAAAALTGLSAANRPSLVGRTEGGAEVTMLRRELDEARGKLAVAEGQVDRLKSIARYSEHYRVSADIAADIYDIALAEGIHPSLGFQLVKVESGFNARARSSANAIGYTQLRLATARFYDSTITEERLMKDRVANLRIGFRFLKDLMRQFDQDLHLALIAYNRGPGRVAQLMARGEDPRNGYSDNVLRGLKKG